MRILWGGANNPQVNEALATWCGGQLGFDRGFGDCSTMGVFEGERLVAVMVYHDWHPDRGVIEISGASLTPKWLTRAVLWEMFSYPFNQIGAQLVVMRVSERNTMWNGRGLPRLLKAYGFNSTHMSRLRGRDEGEIIFTLSDDDWRQNGFHKENAHGQERAEANAA